MSDKNFEQHGDPSDHEQETEFHYPAGKFDEELVEASHGGWASEDFNEEEFDYNFDDSEFGEAHYIDDEILDSGIAGAANDDLDRKSTRLNSSHVSISYAVFCLKKKKANTS